MRAIVNICAMIAVTLGSPSVGHAGDPSSAPAAKPAPSAAPPAVPPFLAGTGGSLRVALYGLALGLTSLGLGYVISSEGLRSAASDLSYQLQVNGSGTASCHHPPPASSSDCNALRQFHTQYDSGFKTSLTLLGTAQGLVALATASYWFRRPPARRTPKRPAVVQFAPGGRGAVAGLTVLGSW